MSDKPIYHRWRERYSYPSPTHEKFATTNYEFIFLSFSLNSDDCLSV